MRRVVITGLGAVTPIGIGVKAFWHGLREGLSGVDTITRFDPARQTCKVAAEVRGFDPRDFLSGRAASLSTAGLFVHFGLAAARMAYDDAGLAAVAGARRFPVCFGSGAGAAPELQEAVEQIAEHGMRRRQASAVVGSIGHALSTATAVELGLAGATMTVGSGCAAGLDAVQWACEEIRSGRAAGALVGAADTPLTPNVHGAWGTLGWLSHWHGRPAEALRPFDALSTGSVLGEGAGAFVLEDLEHARRRGAPVHAEVLGYGSASDGLDLRTVDPAGASLQGAVHGALRTARLDPADVDHVNTHGGGVPAHDRAESAAYRAVFGRHAYSLSVSSIKPMIGQPFAAGGALQLVAACFTLAEQFVPATLNHDFPDAGCDLDYVPNRGRPARVNRLLVATRAIGPTHSVVVLGRPPDG